MKHITITSIFTIFNYLNLVYHLWGQTQHLSSCAQQYLSFTIYFWVCKVNYAHKSNISTYMHIYPKSKTLFLHKSMTHLHTILSQKCGRGHEHPHIPIPLYTYNRYGKIYAVHCVHCSLHSQPHHKIYKEKNHLDLNPIMNFAYQCLYCTPQGIFNVP
jgi:hypothetical protein